MTQRIGEDCHMTQYRWIVITLTFFAIIINYLDRTALSYAVTPLESQFGLNNSDFGIIAAAFGVGYLIMTVIGGILVDQFGARKICIYLVVYRAFFQRHMATLERCQLV